MNDADRRGTSDGSSGGRLRALARRRPVATFSVILVGLVWSAYLIPLLMGWDRSASSIVELVLLVAVPPAVSGWIGGRSMIRRMYSGVVRWRFGAGRYLLVLAAMPALTLLLAATSGSLHDPAGGWLSMTGRYLFMAVVFGALIANLWEETGWSGFVQSRLMARHGLLTGSLLTAVPFGLIHLPLAFQDKGLATRWSDAALTWVVLAGTAPFFRYLIGTVLVDTGGSTLAVALLHGAFNASGSLAAVTGWWQQVAALIVLTLLVTGYRSMRGRSAVDGRAIGLEPPAGKVADAEQPPVTRQPDVLDSVIAPTSR